MMEPLSVAVHAIANVGALRTGQSVLIFGAGPVGLLAMAVAKGLGASRIVAVDINEERLNFAKGYAATDIYVPVCSCSCAFICERQWVMRRELWAWRDGGKVQGGGRLSK